MDYHSEEPWKLYYWPGFPGRGEFVRLLLEEAQVPYIDVGNKEGVSEIMKFIKGENEGFPMAAPPIISRGNVTLSQTPNICFYLGRKYNLCPADEVESFHVNQLALSIADITKEVHDTHHPISSALYYEDQKDAAKKYSSEFISKRIPKWIGYFERVLKSNSHSNSEYLVGSGFTYVDLSLFHVVVGLEFAFPKAMAKIKSEYPLVFAHKDRIGGRPNISAYLKSSRRIPFNHGVFRYYPELDSD